MLKRIEYDKKASIPLGVWFHWLAATNNHLLVDTVLDIPILEPLPRGDAGLVDVDLEDAQASVVAPIAGIPTEAHAAAVAHPQSWLFLFLPFLLLGREGAVVVAMVMPSADHDDTLLDESIVEASIIARRGHTLQPGTHLWQLMLVVLW